MSSIAEYIPPKPGRIVDYYTGKTLGKHEGLWQFTVGQNARIAGRPEKMFVADKDAKMNEILVVPGRCVSVIVLEARKRLTHIP